jgi:hypothetical protein
LQDKFKRLILQPFLEKEKFLKIFEKRFAELKIKINFASLLENTITNHILVL